ncbi:MAG: phosphotransferase, partial [Bacteroidia bacterium]|nr:phosphotransferase [Bacteroidia bacterium]
MKTILKQLGYSVSETKESLDNQKIDVFIIHNSDGTTRWIWPEHVKQPLFLKFYMVNGIKSLMFSIAIKLMFLFKLQSIFFKKKRLFITEIAPDVSFDIMMPWALFKGTIGPNNKSVVFTQKDGIDSFIKIAGTEKAQKLIEKEATLLNRLRVSNIQTFVFPEVVDLTNSVLQLSDISKDAERTSQLSDAHINALIEMNELTSIKMTLSENECWNNLKKELSHLADNQDSRMPKGMIRKLNKLIKQINGNEEIEVCLSHGDFTPWNMFVKDDQLHIYDWELADYFKPLGFDLFHFIVQQGILVKHKSWA